MKELRVRPAISTHDLSYRLEDGRKFLDEGHKVLVVCLFKGRQMAHPEHGYTVMKQVAEDLKDISKVEMQARLQGRRMTMLLSPLPLAQRKAAAKGVIGSRARPRSPASAARTFRPPTRRSRTGRTDAGDAG